MKSVLVKGFYLNFVKKVSCIFKGELPWKSKVEIMHKEIRDWTCCNFHVQRKVFCSNVCSQTFENLHAQWLVIYTGNFKPDKVWMMFQKFETNTGKKDRKYPSWTFRRWKFVLQKYAMNYVGGSLFWKPSHNS